MSMMRRLLLVFFLPLLFCVLSSARAQAAPNCTYTADPSLSFGPVDILNYSKVEAYAQIKVYCTGFTATDGARVCLNFTGGAVNGNQARQMRNGERPLYYALRALGAFTFISNTIDAGLIFFDLNESKPNQIVQLQGILVANQVNRPVGNYTENIQVNFSFAGVSDVLPIDCNFAPSSVSTFPLLVDATITPNCTVTATSLVFPTVFVFTSDVLGQSALTVTCTTNAPYWVSLDNGQNALSGQRRLRSGANYIDYDLYSDSGRTLRWGLTKDVDTVSGLGVNTGKQLPVYGKVPKPAATPPFGNYSDLIIATVNF